MEMIADVLLVAGAIGAGFYCFILARRLSRFNDLEKGVGGAIAVLSAQVDDMTKTLQQAQGSANGSNESLRELTGRAEDVARRLELMVASMHDIPPTEAAEMPADPAPETVEFTHQLPGEPSEAEAQFRSNRNYVQEAAE